ncbi:MAG: xylulokinase [Parvibaculales bacterium]
MNFLGIDLGASALKTVLVQQGGQLLARAQADIATASPEPGWREQNPDDWLTALETALGRLFLDTNVTQDDIAAISITAGAHIGVICGEDHTPLRPAILWSDQRAANEVTDLKMREEAIIKASLHQPNATWTLAHLRWLWAHDYNTLKQARRLSPAKDWLRVQLTGEWATDLSDAVGLQLYDVTQAKWSLPLCALAGILPDILPGIKPPHASGGTVTSTAARRFGLKAGTPVYIGGIDTSTELFNTGITNQETGCLKLASAGVVSVLTDTPDPMPPISCYPQSHGAGWYYASGMNSCAPALHWFRQTYLPDLSMEEMQHAATTAKPGANGVVFHPYINGERAPHWRPDLKPALNGADTADKNDLARAAYEGVGYALLDVRRNLEQLLKREIRGLVALGGGAQNSFWMQMMSDIQGMVIKVPEHTDAAYGAALQAGLAHGAFPNAKVLGNMITYAASYEPHPEQHEIYLDRFADYDHLRRRMTDTPAAPAPS